MATRHHPLARTSRVPRHRRAAEGIVRELVQARRSAGLSQERLARAVGSSQAMLSRIERGQVDPPVGLLAASAAVLGRQLTLRSYPIAPPLRDIAHVRLFARLRALLPGSFAWRTEVPLPIPGDRRAFDARLAVPRLDVAFELESRLTDAQATVRRMELKRRDGGVGVMILVLADTHFNREAVAAGAAWLLPSYPHSARAVLSALRAGRDPPGNGIIFA
jgi:transcriptional regulator with XRE-family HTH domain